MLGQPHAARQWYERAIALRREPLHDDVGVAEGMIDLAVLESDAAHTGAASGQRGCKRQPLGGLMGLGGSPAKGATSVRWSGSIDGIDDNSAPV